MVFADGFESGDLALSVDVMHNGGYYFDAENLIGTGGADAEAALRLPSGFVPVYV